MSDSMPARQKTYKAEYDAYNAYKTSQKDPKMDRFKRFLPIFAKFFALCIACSVLFAGVLVGGAYLDDVIGFPVGLIAVVVAIFGSASAVIAWISSDEPR
jgi:hypothetical protein